MKAHLIASDDPLPSGQPLVAPCKAVIKNSYFVFMFDRDFAKGQAVNMLLCCKKCYLEAQDGRYVYGVIEAQEVMQDDETEA